GRGASVAGGDRFGAGPDRAARGSAGGGPERIDPGRAAADAVHGSAARAAEEVLRLGCRRPDQRRTGGSPRPERDPAARAQRGAQARGGRERRSRESLSRDRGGQQPSGVGSGYTLNLRGALGEQGVGRVVLPGQERGLAEEVGGNRFVRTKKSP